ncbi:ferric iron reductase protein FhuF [Bacillus tianshenii]|uniref:Ferric iron reductase protein FhuF n=1 Tax=Sutcliffiella tianshenii TaxID=1463404 RepID=A0ABS2NUL1_9BACI|nr:IucA/IucC family C-terminal-domain containing protein [Bacillus tianshenii]MBM7618182.1 ferric iron reductase protein FhuF [Bacillus tianshenii]
MRLETESLNHAEQRFLEENGRLVVGSASSQNSVKLASLLEEGAVCSYLATIREDLGTDKNDVAASLLMKRLGFLAVNCLMSMSAYNKTFKIDSGNIWIDSSMDNGTWLPKIRFSVLEVEAAPAIDRNDWRTRHFYSLFKGLYMPLIERIAKDAKVSRQTLWENVMLYVYWLYETILPKIGETKYAEEDFLALLEAPASFFGMNRNPAASFYSDKIYVEKQQAEIRVRSTCCFYYQANASGSRCSTCPLECKV